MRNGSLKKIKCDFFLKEIFNKLNKKKTLDIIKYNKRIQKLLNININDYKECHEQIEIIIEPKKNLEKNYDQFINIENEEEQKYFHIYFNDSHKEEYKDFFDKNEKISNIKVIIDKQVKSFNGLFETCKCIKSIYFKKFYRDNIQDMSSMFSFCSSLEELNLSNFNTSNVSNMSYMFMN